MTDKELANLAPSEVRNNEELMRLYVERYEGVFFLTPSCAGCTFNTDFKKFRSAILNGLRITNPNNIIMENTFKLKRKHYSEILTYRIGNVPFRIYGKQMNEGFAIEYLKNGTKEQIEERKLMFDVLPSKTGTAKKDPKIDIDKSIVENPEEIKGADPVPTPKKRKSTRKAKK